MAIHRGTTEREMMTEVATPQPGDIVRMRDWPHTQTEVKGRVFVPGVTGKVRQVKNGNVHLYTNQFKNPFSGTLDWGHERVLPLSHLLKDSAKTKKLKNAVGDADRRKQDRDRKRRERGGIEAPAPEVKPCKNGHEASWRKVRSNGKSYCSKCVADASRESMRQKRSKVDPVMSLAPENVASDQQV